MTYRVGKLKHTLYLLFNVAVLAAIAVLGILLIEGDSRWMLLALLAVGAVVFIVPILRDYTYFIVVKEEGIEYHRRGVHETIPWSNIRRLQHQGLKKIPLFDAMVIHTYSDHPSQKKPTRVIDFSVAGHREAYREIVRLYREHVPNAKVDKGFDF